jgi:hypothetical protein
MDFIAKSGNRATSCIKRTEGLLEQDTGERNVTYLGTE